MRLFIAICLFALSESSCVPSTLEECTSESTCTQAAGVWVPVADATYIPGTALAGGRRYTLGQSDSEFSTTISAPNGGYCTRPVSTVPSECESNASACASMGDCFYRSSGRGRWFQTEASMACVATCSDPLVFCDKSRCESAMGCSWFVLTQSNADECYCMDNPGVFGNPPEPAKITWIFWDQPGTLPIFIIAILGGLGIAYYVFIFNLMPLIDALKQKMKPKE